jgi:hypothetical protein
MSAAFEDFLAAAPWPQRVGLRAGLELARRPRGELLLARTRLLGDALAATLALARYDDPELAVRLGWDAEVVAARGRELRRAEGRP